jgi:hypothetical protein
MTLRASMNPGLLASPEGSEVCATALIGIRAKT